jgi:glycosyltransferase involved in cell wall biosynthesis
MVDSTGLVHGRCLEEGRGPALSPTLTIRIAVVVPAWRQSQYLAGAVRSALDQEIGTGVIIVNDGCPDPETHRIGETLRDAHPDRIAYLRQPNGGLSAARNAGIRRAFARWPQVEAIFPLDADNLLSPQTLTKLSMLLDERPDAAWASPTLEFFGAEQGEWEVPGPYLPYRQLYTNQCDAGTLIRSSVFDAGIGYDETMREGFEDWEFFLRTTLAGFGGVKAGRCGFRYRRRPESMVAMALRQAEVIEAEIRRRHRGAYEPAALLRREHAEAPRFALVRCNLGDVLLTASPGLEPRRLNLAEFARLIAGAAGAEPSPTDHVPAVTVLTTSATIDRLEAGGSLAEALSRIQSELPGRRAVGLRIGGGALSALALRAGVLDCLSADFLPEPEALVEVEPGGTSGDPLPATAANAAALIGGAFQGAEPLPETSHSSFFERLHVGRLEPMPSAGDKADRTRAGAA